MCIIRIPTQLTQTAKSLRCKIFKYVLDRSLHENGKCIVLLRFDNLWYTEISTVGTSTFLTLGAVCPRTEIVPETCTHLAFFQRPIWPCNGAGKRFGQINMKRGHVAKINT